MKTDTTKLYQRMTSKEKAAVYVRTYDSDELKKIVSTVPWFNYSALDREFVEERNHLTFASLWWEAEYWKTLTKLNEELWEIQFFHSMQHGSGLIEKAKVIANIYSSRVKGLEEALIHHDLGYIRDNLDSLSSDDLAMIHELELLPEYVDKFKANAISVMDMILS